MHSIGTHQSLSSTVNVNPRRKNIVDLQIRHTEDEYRVAIAASCAETVGLQSITIDIARRDGRLIWTFGTREEFPKDGERVSDGGCHHKQTLLGRGGHVAEAEAEWICTIPFRPSDIPHRCVWLYLVKVRRIKTCQNGRPKVDPNMGYIKERWNIVSGYLRDSDEKAICSELIKRLVRCMTTWRVGANGRQSEFQRHIGTSHKTLTYSCA